MTADFAPEPRPLPARPTPAPEPPAGEPPALLRARGLRKSFGRTAALRGVDLDIPERGFTTLLGPSGCGKTTVLRLIAGFERADAGTLALDGVDIGTEPPERRPVNTVFQSYALFPHLTVAENVGFSLALRRLGADAIALRVARALDSVHLHGLGERYPGELSGGQQQRVAVARAIIAEPRLLLLDEPLSALDRKLRGHLQAELKDLQRRLGIAFVYVTHDQDEAFALSDLVLLMNAGTIVQRGSPRTIYQQPASAFVADFIGGATLVAGTVLRAGGGRATLATPFGAVETAAVAGLRDGETAVLCVRPEHVAITAGAGLLRATVTRLVYQGGRTLVELEGAGQHWRLWTDEPPSEGTIVGLAIDAARTWITRP